VWNVLLYSLLYIIKCWMQRSALLRTLCGTFSLSHYGSDKIPLNWYRLWNMSCLLRLPTSLPSNFKAPISSRNMLRALNDAIMLLADRCNVGHKNAQSPARACPLVAGTQDVALLLSSRHWRAAWPIASTARYCLQQPFLRTWTLKPAFIVS
jgi:hypothetical protein